MMKNLEGLHNLRKQEQLIGEQITAAIAANDALRDHLSAVQDAMEHLVTLLDVPSPPGSSQHTLQLLAMRLFNVGGSTLAVGLTGYYQAAFQLLRDALELVNLLDLFRIDTMALSRWMSVKDKKAGEEFKPVRVRTKLEAHPDFSGQRRDHIYAAYSNAAIHPTFNGMRLITTDNVPKLGPFFDAVLLTALLEDLAAHLSHATLAVSILINENSSYEVLTKTAGFLDRLRRYEGKYLRR